MGTHPIFESDFDCLTDFSEMGRNNRTRKFAEMKRMIKARDGRLNPDSKRRKKKQEVSKRSLKDGKIIERQLPKASSALFFQYNEQLGPPYHVIVDTNFINFTLKNRLDIKEGMKDCLMAKVTPYVTDCVVAEWRNLGQSTGLHLESLNSWSDFLANIKEH